MKIVLVVRTIIKQHNLGRDASMHKETKDAHDEATVLAVTKLIRLAEKRGEQKEAKNCSQVTTLT